MPSYRVHSIIDGQPTFDVPLTTILAELKAGGALEVLSPAEYLTGQQVRWWKGVLLPSLAKETGESVSIWETRLKLAVLPDDFKAEYVSVDGRPYATIPSITRLGKRKMAQLIDGAVAQCHEWGFSWVTLPDNELKG
jgi:hypothetical protein